MIERVTGTAPPTCPWRAFYEPIVREVVELSWAIKDGNLAAVIGTDPPHQLAQALGVYERAVRATLADEDRIRRDEREAESRARSLSQKMRGR